MSELTLHNYFRSSTSIRVRIALALKGLDYDYVAWNLREGAQQTPEYLAINPHGVVPTLVVDGQALTQSIPIIEYLEQTVPDPALLPTSPLDRARVRGLAAMIACDIHPLNNLKVLTYLEVELGVDTEARAHWFRHWVQMTFGPLEAMLANDPRTGQFCHGDKPGLADICLYAQVMNNRRFKIGLEDYPTIARIYDACSTLAAFVQGAPEAQPDAS
ncbi:maleylacetoacetate isomerase [Devosia limi DSM 17137]|uniref:Maleylacetoacetate isomerase n=1 Tax=Devosia limi DSM 17137 TaxID=1121477 RepID=A0A0F5LVT3_9HYPH|nr:maleylacetoacetate isomerase [Devosia limi]KKB86396.1 maleylacetoacetate isomerase [Devosia limi DSM 17137]SHE90531.1 maleylpyruvate isomerase [Devosia limi DSM 17137]